MSIRFCRSGGQRFCTSLIFYWAISCKKMWLTFNWWRATWPFSVTVVQRPLSSQQNCLVRLRVNKKIITQNSFHGQNVYVCHCQDKIKQGLGEGVPHLAMLFSNIDSVKSNKIYIFDIRDDRSRYWTRYSLSQRLGASVGAMLAKSSFGVAFSCRKSWFHLWRKQPAMAATSYAWSYVFCPRFWRLKMVSYANCRQLYLIKRQLPVWAIWLIEYRRLGEWFSGSCEIKGLTMS